MGYETVTPLSALSRAAIDAYLARNPRAGDVPVFPELRRPNDCASRDIAEHWLRQAEKRAQLPDSRGAATTHSEGSSPPSADIYRIRMSWPQQAGALSP